MVQVSFLGKFLWFYYVILFSQFELDYHIRSHHNIWGDAKVPRRNFSYYDLESKGLNFQELIDDIKVKKVLESTSVLENVHRLIFEVLFQL